MIRLIDIGGSGVKTCKVRDDFFVKDFETIEIQHFSNPDWDNFVEFLNNNSLLDGDKIAISSPGFIRKNGIIELFRVGSWHKKDLVSEIKKIVNHSSVYLLNDAEAHLYANIKAKKFGFRYYTTMLLSIGTSVGFAISNQDGEIVKTLDELNFDIGCMSIKTSASNAQVWHALGSNGLQELEMKHGYQKAIEQYGYRLGGLLVSLATIFKPEHIVLSGGITENHFENFKPYMFAEFNNTKPDWLDFIEIRKSEYSKNSALIGMAKYANRKL